MTATTIGLGDIAPQTQCGRGYGIAHMVLSVVLFGSILGTILSALDRRTAALKKEEMLKRRLDVDLISSLDKVLAPHVHAHANVSMGASLHGLAC